MSSNTLNRPKATLIGHGFVRLACEMFEHPQANSNTTSNALDRSRNNDNLSQMQSYRLGQQASTLLQNRDDVNTLTDELNLNRLKLATAQGVRYNQNNNLFKNNLHH